MITTSKKSYLDIGSAKDLEPFGVRLFYRMLEIIPGSLVWFTFALMILGSIYRPLWAMIFIIELIDCHSIAGAGNFVF